MDIESGIKFVWIEIVSIPGGDAPEWVRETWIGLKLPAFAEGDEGLAKVCDSVGVVSGKREPKLGARVLGLAAFEILREANEAVWEWWNINTEFVADEGCVLVFFGDCWRTCDPPESGPWAEMVRQLSN